MKSPETLSRRLFVKNTLLASASLMVGGQATTSSGALFGNKHDPDRGLKLGLTTYTLRKFSLDQAIAMTREAGLKYISLKDMHLPLKSTRAERQEAHEKVKSAGLVLMGGGVIYLKNNEQEIRDAFEYAEKSPFPDARDLYADMYE